MSNKTLTNLRKITPTEKVLESIESLNQLSFCDIISYEFDSRKDSQPIKSEPKPILVK